MFGDSSSQRVVPVRSIFSIRFAALVVAIACSLIVPDEVVGAFVRNVGFRFPYRPRCRFFFAPLNGHAPLGSVGAAGQRTAANRAPSCGDGAAWEGNRSVREVHEEKISVRDGIGLII